MTSSLGANHLEELFRQHQIVIRAQQIQVL
jgi:hypothetical protein